MLEFMARRGFLVLTTVWLAATHAGVTYLRVPDIGTSNFAQHASELKVTPGWRYGFVHGHHGAHLVKARNISDAAARRPGSSLDSGAGGKGYLRAAMAEDLRTYKTRSALEAGFYVLLLAYVFWAAPALKRKLIPEFAACPRHILYVVAATAAGWTFVCLPILCTGYGSSLFSTWEGHGAMSWSGPYYGFITGTPGETISYRPVLEVLSAFPAGIVGHSSLAPSLSVTTIGGFIWVSGLMFYCTAAAACRLFLCLFDMVTIWLAERRTGRDEEDGPAPETRPPREEERF
ncbi:MAG: hypothetical protein C0404_14315 [Verrucomicrobia bacterium]|nr:hypothetical protein [Verrucomicrobiota bacterium]